MNWGCKKTSVRTHVMKQNQPQPQSHAKQARTKENDHKPKQKSNSGKGCGREQKTAKSDNLEGRKARLGEPCVENDHWLTHNNKRKCEAGKKRNCTVLDLKRNVIAKGKTENKTVESNEGFKQIRKNNNT